MVELPWLPPAAVPLCVVEAAVVAVASAGLEAPVSPVRPEVVPGAVAVVDGAAAVVAAEAGVLLAPPNKLEVVADVVAGVGAALAGVDPKSDEAAAGAVVAAGAGAEVEVVLPNKPPGLVVAAPPNGFGAVELAGAGAPVAGGCSFPLAPNSEPAVLGAGAACEPGAAPPKTPDDGAVVSGFFANRLLLVSWAAPPKTEPPAACVFAPPALVFPKSDEPPGALGAAGWLLGVPPACFEF